VVSLFDYGLITLVLKNELLNYQVAFPRKKNQVVQLVF